MCESLKPFPARQVTVITDFTHSPTHPWLQSHDQFVVCPTGDSYRQSLQLGYDESSCVRISGPVVRPQFYPQSGDEDQKVTWRLRLGLDPTWPTYLLLFGGSPPTRLVEEIALALVAQSNAETQLNIVCICGSNERLFDLLSQHQARGTLPNTRLFGRSDDVPTIMKSVDVVVTKPGPGVVSEALVTRTPLVLFCDGRTMEQELPVETFVRIHGVGKIVDSPSQVYCQSSELVQIRQAMTRLPENQGVFELREFLLSRVF
uniref:Glycosyl transferase family 28 C-terminal domain-containing protein n=1 Tax=Compsopogon caeruleus TaxID=31354 RepID=A0A7S1TDA5_9RHOD|mmetsp:Transcript_17637/g.36594  ORF Transcript_17637/g.36594 Transcript_17637/m.36594 type:complete len:260 (+) Transcript_17637:286-1065(+)